MEKCIEQRRNLHIVFIDLTKAFDNANRDMLFKILGKLGCPVKFICIIQKLHSDTHTRVIIDGELSNPIAYNSGVKQGCKLAPTLFGIFAAVLLYLAFKRTNSSYNIGIHFRYDGGLFDLRRLKSKSKTFNNYEQLKTFVKPSMQIDITIFCNDAIGLQLRLIAYDTLSKQMGLKVKIEKIKMTSVGRFFSVGRRV